MNNENVFEKDINDVEDFEELTEYYGIDDDEFDEDGEPKELNFG